MKAHVHYEAAFEDFLRKRGIPYVAVDEARRAAFRESKLKSFDFIVYSATTCNWLADVKGRRWAAKKAGATPRWENWVTRADIDGLTQWQEVFGEGFRALLIFAYWIGPGQEPPPEIVHAFREARYVFAAVPVDDYLLHAKVRSPKWGTVNLSAADFARLVRPIDQCL
ncbi:MAG: HYExAFE family protein [Phycisphaerales bacterium]|nr:HYExAFE family protein [Phycisphaerales bacterium]